MAGKKLVKTGEYNSYSTEVSEHLVQKNDKNYYFLDVPGTLDNSGLEELSDENILDSISKRLEQFEQNSKIKFILFQRLN